MSSLTMHKRLVAVKCDGVHEETPGVDGNELVILFRRTFWSGNIMDYFQISLASQCHRKLLPVRDKLSRHGYTPDVHVRSVHRVTKPYCTDTFRVCTLLTCKVMLNSCCHVWLRVRLTAESIMRIAMLPSSRKQSSFLPFSGSGERVCLVDEAKRYENRYIPLG